MTKRITSKFRIKIKMWKKWKNKENIIWHIKNNRKACKRKIKSKEVNVLYNLYQKNWKLY